MVLIFYYSSLNDFGTSGSKNTITQNVEAPCETLDIILDIVSNKKFILNPPFYKVLLIYLKTIKLS
jgi:hypothetical protein